MSLPELKIEVILQSILNKIKAHEKLHLGVQLERLLPIKIRKCPELEAKTH